LLSASISRQASPRAGWFWEDLPVGRRQTIRLSLPHGESNRTGAVRGLSAILELLSDGDPPPAVTGLTWSETDPLPGDDPLQVRLLSTRRSASPDGSGGEVSCALDLLASSGRQLQEASLTLWVPSRTRSAREVPQFDVGTRAWGDLLRARLDEDQVFTQALATWDGCVGLRCGAEEVHLRVYRGRILEAVPRTPHGATFTVAASERAWVELLLAPTNDFFRRLMSGTEFAVSGSAYEYLRTTKALVALVDCARQMADEVTE
jgi:hypothetical protein